MKIKRDIQYYKFCSYGFLKNLKFFEPFIILFYLEKGLTFTQIGTLYAIREITRNIFEIPSGVMADVFGRRKTMIFSFSLYIVSYVIFYLADNFLVLVPAVFVFGFGDAFRTGTHKAMIFEYLKLNNLSHLKAHYYGHTRSWSQRGSAVSALLGALFVFYKGNYSVIFLFATVPYAIDLIMIMTYPKELDGTVIHQYKKGAFINSFKEVIHSIINSLKNSRILKCTFNVSIFSGFNMAVKDYIQTVIKTLAVSFPLLWGFAEKQQVALLIGMVYFIIYILTSHAAKSAGRLSDKFGKKALNITLFAGFSAGMISGLFFGLNYLIPALLFFIGIYLVENLRKPVGIAYISEQYEEKVLATALSVTSQAETLIASVFAVFLGLIADYVSIGISIFIISLISIILTFFIRISETS